MTKKTSILVSLILFTTSYVSSQVNLTSGLVAHYPFTGSASDASGNANHPAFNNATLATDRFGNTNKAYAFNGTNSYIRIPTSNSLNTGNQISISLWVKPTGFHYGTCFGNNIIQKGAGGLGDAQTGNYLLRYDDALYTNYQNCSRPLPDTLHQNFHLYDVKSSNYITKNTWYYLTYTCDGIKSRFYVNGVQVDSTAANNIPFTNAFDLYFGYSNNPVNPFWLNGTLDDIRIYNRAINKNEIAALYNETSLTSGLVAHYPFTGNASDSSGNANHSAFNNATLAMDRFGNANKAYAFNGTNSYIRIPTSNSLNTGNQISISVWVKPTGFHYGTCFGNNILQKGAGGNGDALTGNYLLRFDDAYYTNYQNCSRPLPDTTHQNFHLYDVKSSSYITKNTWYYLTYTCDGVKSRFYVNSVQVDSAAANSILFTNAHDLYFGYSNNPVNPFWLNGALDDIRIYNRAINLNEIAALYNENTVLPLTLLTFNGNKQNDAINLQWTTTNEINTASFSIQRATDGTNFNDIGLVSANGNTTSTTAYTFTDNQPNNGKNYYRLKMIDKDGSFTYSSVLTFTTQATIATTFKLSPNPAKTYVQLQVAVTKDDVVNVTIFDAAGKKLITQQNSVIVGTNVLRINNINTLKSGLYFVQMAINGSTSTQKLIIE